MTKTRKPNDYDLPQAPLVMPEQLLERPARTKMRWHNLYARLALIWRPGV